MLNNRCKTYKFSEYRELNNEYTVVEKIIEHIKINKMDYSRLVFITAVLLNGNIIVYADTGVALDVTFGQLIDLLMKFAKWGCLGLGLKKTIEEMLAGANFKQASIGGIQYWLAYIFIQFYPRLFDMIKL